LEKWKEIGTGCSIGKNIGECRQKLSYDPTSSECNDVLTLDGSTLGNLQVLRSEEGDRRGTLIEFVDHCATKFGRRMLEQWLANPLRALPLIERRLDAVEYLIDDGAFWDDELAVNQRLHSLPDLERICQHLAALGTAGRPMDEAVVFTKHWDEQKVRKLLAALNGFEAVQRLYDDVEGHRGDIDSVLINEITTVVAEERKDDGGALSRCGGVPEFGAVVRRFKESFDWEMAERDGVIQPTPGHNDEFDANVRALHENEKALHDILRGVRRRFSCAAVRWNNQNRGGRVDKKWCLEIPKKEGVEVPSSWHHRAGTKALDRYQSDEIIKLVEEREALEDAEEVLLRDAARQTFARFAVHGKLWRKIVVNVATLDCLLSLSRVSQSGVVGPMSRPNFVEPTEAKPAVLEIRDGRHPAIDEQQLNALGQQGAASSFIPNDVVLGTAENAATFVVVTGPNMGGKSTLLRQSCVAVILAHIGCFVPCSAMTLTVVDRIFTRVGANDRILSGQSTFMVELEETANILRHSTPRSLVILDELGRGTTTFDGTAIAYAVAKAMANDIRCRCLFSTHYHGLADSLTAEDGGGNVASYHMAYREKGGKITFLYKFTKGICDQSHGINCGRLAGLPEPILERAALKSKQLAIEMAGRRGKEQQDDAAALLEHFEAVMASLVHRHSMQQTQRKLI